VACHSRTASIVNAQVSANDALMRDKASSKNCYAIALRVMPVVPDYRIIRISIIYIECATIYAGAISKKCFVLSNYTIMAHPRPDGIWSSNFLGILHTRVPRDARSDAPTADTKQNDSISLHIVNDGVTYNGMTALSALGWKAKIASAYKNSCPL
jgi:hypothetical protein